ncbi:MAG: NfeD family protein [Castellaniella sp.]|jgi:membrane protein implicated in regulation of membrane protease activity|uniref:NfeD family protein n=1 Tax=Castellaniella sp. TaxID=1955812 RepID=UPI003C77D08E
MEFLNVIFNNPWIWLILGVIVMGLELIVPGVYLFWVGAGLITTGVSVVAFADLPGIPLAAQIVIFMVAMFGWVLTGIYLQNRVRQAAPSALNAGLAQYAGRQVPIVQVFADSRRESQTSYLGRIKLEDTTYGVISRHPLQEGQFVVILAYQDGKFLVEPASN